VLHTHEVIGSTPIAPTTCNHRTPPSSAGRWPELIHRAQAARPPPSLGGRDRPGVCLMAVLPSRFGRKNPANRRSTLDRWACGEPLSFAPSSTVCFDRFRIIPTEASRARGLWYSFYTRCGLSSMPRSQLRTRRSTALISSRRRRCGATRIALKALGDRPTSLGFRLWVRSARQRGPRR
jgi:hypothetical protein